MTAKTKPIGRMTSSPYAVMAGTILCLIVYAMVFALHMVAFSNWLGTDFSRGVGYAMFVTTTVVTIVLTRFILRHSDALRKEFNSSFKIEVWGMLIISMVLFSIHMYSLVFAHGFWSRATGYMLFCHTLTGVIYYGWLNLSYLAPILPDKSQVMP